MRSINHIKIRNRKIPGGVNLSLFLVLLLSVQTVAAQKIVDYVNPFIGTTNFGATNPGAVVPQGMVSVVPFNVSGSADNTFDKDSRWWSTPYGWENNYFTGYSHVNLSGVGCPELGVILLMPTSGEVTASNKAYGSAMSSQQASPGYYSNQLTKYGIKTEVTATERAGLSKFTFPAGKSNILIDLGAGLTNENGAMIRVVNNREMEGWRMTGSFCYNDGSERPVYFVARFSQAADEFGVWKKMPAMKAEASWTKTNNQFKYYESFNQHMAGDSIGAWMTFNTKPDTEILVKVGVSYVSIDNARENLDAEIDGFDFENVVEQAAEKWEKTLSKVKVKGGTEDQKTIFYTALYHTQLHPNIIQDVNGQYPEMESNGIGKTCNNRYTVFSLWDTYRNLHPLMSLIYPDKQLDMVRSMVDMYQESGWMPKWELNSKETHVMEGDPAIPVIVDTYLRGLRDFDVEAAWQAMRKSATTKGSDNKLRPDIDDYLQKGYVPLTEEFDNSVSHALEYYIADWNLAQLAKSIGKTEDYHQFLKQSQGYKNYFDAEYGVLRPKLADGSFLTPFNPRQGENFEPCPGFHEGTAWQYTFAVPHDVEGLMKLMGGKNAFVQKLQKVFDEGLFDMANEPDIHYPWLFNFVKGEEWRGQKELARLIETYFKNTPDGLPGNDDCGTLSAWLVYGMMGFYPVCPGNMDYALANPVFDEVSIELDPNFYPGKTITIRKAKSTKTDAFVRSIRWNGKTTKNFFIKHNDLVSGGVLEFIR
ncbi:GH92 family glycosyl hydrolase [Mangrovibacterium sp.]|uniref:GH92 family glycosyl hydrolase n=1 Tax=Mangrovibacterium sp. TaxID=1961364 RepID=UPI003562F1EE